MISCLIADDEPLAVQLLEDYIQQTNFLCLKHKCHTALDALNFLKKNAVDVLFLDINMPKLTGIEMTSLLPPSQKIIFTTAYSEYAVQSYEKNAVDYLLKPITFERFMKAAAKVEKLHENSFSMDETLVQKEQSHTFIKCGRSIKKIAFNSIMFIEGLKDYVSINTTEEKLITYKRMKDLEITLPSNFLRVHNSFIVNLNSVKRYEENTIYIDNNQIPIREKYKEFFLAAIRKYVL